MPIGTAEHPLPSMEPMTVADHIRVDNNIGSLPGIAYHQGIWYIYRGDRWMSLEREEMENLCWNETEHAVMATQDGGVRRFAPNKQKVENVARALQVKCTIPNLQLPCWLSGSAGKPAPEDCIAFNDVVMHIPSMATVRRDPSWFGHSIVPCDFDPEAKCPRWIKCIDQWSCGDGQWTNLLQRWFGYCLMSHRRYAKWLLMYGKVRGGKGTISRVLHTLVGDSAWNATNLRKLGERFGVNGMQQAKVVCIHEVEELDSRNGEATVQFIKSVIGRDPIPIEPKFKDIMRNVVIDAAIMMQSNEIPKLSNKGQGLSSKMLVLPFESSFLGKEDDRLDEKLMEEIPGIAAWAVRGAVEMANDVKGNPIPRQPFTIPDRARDAVRRYNLVNNPFDAFLESRFERRPDGSGFVSYEKIWEIWQSWIEDNELPIKMSRYKFTQALMEGTSWEVTRGRHDASGPRGFRGLSLSETRKDDDVI